LCRIAPFSPSSIRRSSRSAQAPLAPLSNALGSCCIISLTHSAARCEPRRGGGHGCGHPGRCAAW
jgi:hypothetical protein